MLKNILTKNYLVYGFIDHFRNTPISYIQDSLVSFYIQGIAKVIFIGECG